MFLKPQRAQNIIKGSCRRCCQGKSRPSPRSNRLLKKSQHALQQDRSNAHPQAVSNHCTAARTGLNRLEWIQLADPLVTKTRPLQASYLIAVDSVLLSSSDPDSFWRPLLLQNKAIMSIAEEAAYIVEHAKSARSHCTRAACEHSFHKHGAIAQGLLRLKILDVPLDTPDLDTNAGRSRCMQPRCIGNKRAEVSTKQSLIVYRS